MQNPLFKSVFLSLNYLTLRKDKKARLLLNYKIKALLESRLNLGTR